MALVPRPSGPVFAGPIAPGESTSAFRSTGNDALSGGQVLGASTTASNGGSTSRPVASTSNNNSQQSSSSSNPGIDVNGIYDPIIQNLQKQGQGLQSQFDTQSGLLKNQYTGQQKTIGDQLSQLQGTLQGNQSTFGNQLQSAYSQASNDYNQMQNYYLNLFGGGSSAGPAATQLLQQAYQQSLGNLQNTNLQAQNDFNSQGQGITSWGDTQNNNLNGWYQSAQNQIYGVFQNGMSAINSAQNMAESEKASAKLDLLQQVINQQQAIQNYATQLQGQLAVVDQMSGAQVSPYDRSTMTNQMSQLGQLLNSPSQISQLTNVAQQAGMSPQQAQGWVAQTGGSSQNNQDALSQLAGFNTGTLPTLSMPGVAS